MDMASGCVRVEKLKENLTCPICYDIFDKDLRQPKGLPCGHTICFTCLDAYVKKSLKEKYECPMCLVNFSVPNGGVNDMPTNLTAKNMLELLPAEENNNMDKRDDQPKPLCQQHGWKEFVFVCTKCRVGLCNTCISTMTTGPHYAHMKDVDELSVAMDEIQTDSKVKLKKLNEILDKHKDAYNDAFAKLREWKSTAIDEVEQKVDGIIRSAVTYKKELETKINELYGNALKDIQSLKDKDNQMQDDFNPKLIKAELEKMCRTYDFDIYMVRDDMINRLQKTEEQLEDVNVALRSLMPSFSIKGINFPLDISCLSENNHMMYLVVNDIFEFERYCANLGYGEVYEFFGQTYYIQTFAWKLCICMHDDEKGKKWLGLYLKRDASSTHRCIAGFNGSIQSHKDVQHNFEITDDRTNCYSSKQDYFGWKKFITWEELTQSTNGYIKDKNLTVIAKVNIQPALADDVEVDEEESEDSSSE